jgi:hypothetical protein
MYPNAFRALLASKEDGSSPEYARPSSRSPSEQLSKARFKFLESLEPDRQVRPGTHRRHHGTYLEESSTTLESLLFALAVDVLGMKRQRWATPRFVQWLQGNWRLHWV